MTVKLENYFCVDQKIIIITGVSGQLGLEYAKAFIGSNAIVVGLDVHRSNGSQELEKNYPNQFKFICIDITDKDALSASLHGAPLAKIRPPGVACPSWTASCLAPLA